MSLKAQRGPVRAAFTRTKDELSAVLEEEEPDKQSVKVLVEKMDRHHQKMIQLDELVVQKMMEDEADEDEFETEYEMVSSYHDSYFEVMAKVRVLFKDDEDEKVTDVRSVSVSSKSAADPAHPKKKYRLPKLELTKFEGDPKEWITFWSQFKSIHEDNELCEEEKFQYLIQSTKENSTARSVVTSFPPSKDNYPKAVKYLKERFGRDEILVEVYVRELLSLVISNSQKKTSSLSITYDRLETQLRALETLGVTSDKYAAMLYPLVESSLPEDVMRTWERSRAAIVKDGDLLTGLMSFIRTEVDGEERIKMAKKGFSTEKKSGKDKQSPDVPTATDLFSGERREDSSACIFCEKGHRSVDCFKLSTMSYEDKIRIVKEKNACFVCLRKGHISKKCKSKIRCPICEKRHLAVMCSRLEEKREKDTSLEKKVEQKTPSLSNFGNGHIALQTILVKLQKDGVQKVVRALFDSGCQHSYISPEAAKVMKLEERGTVDMAHLLFGGQETRKIKHSVYNVVVKSIYSNDELGIKVLEQPTICGDLERLRSGPWQEELRQHGIDISDVGEDDADIHLLFGADILGHLYTGRIFKTESGPVAMQTIFGWTLTGVIKQEKYSTSSTDLLSISLFSTRVSMDNLWKLEVLGIRDPVEVQSNEKMIEAAVKNFQETIRVNEEDRYEVGLPWSEGNVKVADNFEMAKKRLKTVEKKLSSTGKLEVYGKIFQEWEELGIIEEVPVIERENPGSYLPHRPNFNPNSTTTPVRPVFDASASSNGLPSLNECLHKGPNLIELIPAIVTRFRMRRIGITSDIKKAFLQISIRREDRDYLRFLWQKESSENEDSSSLKMYRHCRVVFGVSSSPFLLGATLNHHLDQISERDSSNVKLLRKSLYVDNCIVSLDSLEEAYQFKEEASHIMNKGKFELRGWTWNGDESAEDTMSILGITWNKKADTLNLDLSSIEKEGNIVTLRTIMSAAQRVFDPMGYCSPVTLIPKLIIQKLWQLKLKMDDEAPEELKKMFRKWIEDLPALSKVSIPRWVVEGPLEECKLSIHGFSDGSKDAYAGCVFLRSEYGGSVTVQLLMSKARVAPMKSTIPRTELLGCVVMARLVSNIIKYMDIGEIETYLWTDSTNALYWIKNEDNWGLFVFNRVKEILSLTRKEDWRHLPGVDNPADLPSRGCQASSFLEKHWWEGPQWLKKEKSEWPQSSIMYEMEEVMQEKRKKPTISMSSREEDSFFYRYSSFKKLVRVVAWMLRSCNRGKGDRSFLKLSTRELEYAELVVWRKIQKEEFQETKLFKEMHAKKDEYGVRRVRSKIILREDSVDFRFPILLPSKHPVVMAMIREAHLKNHHAGVNILMCLLREKYWIIHTRKNISKVVNGCVRCRRFQAKPVRPEEPPLPVERVRDAEIFEIIGIDLGGPLFLHKSRKVWFVVFSCGVYRALHLELVSSLSTESKIFKSNLTKSIRRFIARRGRPAVIYSDNGTNFVGLENLMKELDWVAIAKKTGEEKIEWRFNPPASPWWGGFYERMVGMVKKLLRRNLGKATLNFEDLETVLFEIEATINARPLTYMSEDPEDPISLSPALLMGLKKPIGVADLDQLDGSAFRRKHGELQKIRNDLQKRFRSEYLGALVHKDKFVKTEEVRIGDIVIVELENVGRAFWPLGRVIEITYGRDGIIRKVHVKTATSIMSRSVQKIRLLEIRD